MGRRGHRLWLAILIAVIAAVVPAARAFAATLTADERASLDRGEVVKRPLALSLDSGHYVGGVAYTIIRARADAVMAALGDVAAYTSILPLTQEAREIKRGRREALVALRHGGRLGSASYTVRIRRENRNEIRFWLDPTRPHDVDDAWGYFRVEPRPDGTSLLTYGAVVNLGFGVARMFFEGRVRDIALDTPALVKGYVEGRVPRRRGHRLVSR